MMTKPKVRRSALWKRIFLGAILASVTPILGQLNDVVFSPNTENAGI